MKATHFEMSTDCPNVINLAIGLNMMNVNPVLMQSVRDNCCNTPTTLVTCSNNKVVDIDWSHLNLNGKINGTALPSTLTGLYLDNNPITESIFQFPPNLRYVDLSVTLMAMGLPVLPTSIVYVAMYISKFTNVTNLPEGMTNFNSGQAKLSGSLPAIPSTMEKLHIDGNSLSGSLPFLPNSLSEFKCNSNMYSGSIPSLPSGLTLGQFQNNLFAGSLPVIPLNVLEINFGYNSFTGSVTINSNQLKVLNLEGNYFTGELLVPNTIQQLTLGHVSKPTNKFSGSLVLEKPTLINIYKNSISYLSITDNSVLSSCELSYNPIVNSNHNNFTICSVNGISATLPAKSSTSSTSQVPNMYSTSYYTSIKSLGVDTTIVTSSIPIQTFQSSTIHLLDAGTSQSSPTTSPSKLASIQSIESTAITSSIIPNSSYSTSVQMLNSQALSISSLTQTTALNQLARTTTWSASTIIRIRKAASTASVDHISTKSLSSLFQHTYTSSLSSTSTVNTFTDQRSTNLIVFASPSFGLFGKLIIDWIVLTFVVTLLYQRCNTNRKDKRKKRITVLSMGQQF